jgi:phosphomannomutase
LLERSTAGAARLVIASVVSSPSLAAIADAMGARFAYTLTGFKWIANKAMELEPKGAEFLFGYEEALGYSVGTLVRDKDGISAAVVLAALAAELYARGETLLDQLERIARRYGLYTSAQRSLKFPGSEGKQAMSAIMTRLRQAPPTTIGDHDVVAFSDCLTGVRHQGDERGAVDLPTSDVLIFDLAGGHRVIARPSGTEPKMKIYFDVRADLADGENLEVAKSRATDITAALEKDILALAGV